MGLNMADYCIYLGITSVISSGGHSGRNEKRKGVITVCWMRLLPLLFNYSFVFVMGSDPNPDEIMIILYGESSVIHSGPY
jgi:hypothetical protein